MAQAAFTYSGQGFSPRGEKSRFVLPPNFRKTVKESGEGNKTLCIGMHDRWTCLVGFGLSRKDDLHAQIDREEQLAATAGRDFDRDMRAMKLFNFVEVSFDDSGRFIMPDHLANLAKVGEELYFHGAGAFFTVWSPEVLGGMGEGWESAQAACASLMAEASAKAKSKGAEA